LNSKKKSLPIFQIKFILLFPPFVTSMATTVQAQIFEDLDVSADMKGGHDEFDVQPMLPPEYGGAYSTIAMDVLDRETTGDQALYDQLVRGTVPTIDSVFR
jgi:hypothetical protein